MEKGGGYKLKDGKYECFGVQRAITITTKGELHYYKREITDNTNIAERPPKTKLRFIDEIMRRNETQEWDFISNLAGLFMLFA